MTPEPAIQNFEENFDKHLQDLKKLARIPSISFPGFDHSIIDQSAKAVIALFKEIGLENIQILKAKNSFPYVYADWLKNKNAPTVLLYAHHDVQPIGRKDIWKTEPFEPTEKDGPGGKRLYGRGTADDKAGIIIHTASIASYLKTLGELPVNVKVLIEGEEEIGSPHLSDFLNEHASLLQADTMILTDCTNYDYGMPSLTVSLRGLVKFEVEVRALNKTIHSGLWGGPIPDPVMGLAKTLSSLTDEKGDIAVPEIQKMIKPLTEEEKKNYADLPFDEKLFREQTGMLDSVEFWQKDLHPYAAISRFPSLMITAIQASSREQAGNIINDVAWATVTIRTPAFMEWEKVLAALKKHITKNTPWGLNVKFLNEQPDNGWAIDPYAKEHKDLFEAVHRSLEKGYDAKSFNIGCGGSIPFTKPLSHALKGATPIMVGIEDPYTNAHGENESMLISDFKKAIRSEIYMFAELAKVLKK